jgi:hypothetical protein
MKPSSRLLLTALALSTLPAFSQTMTLSKASYKPGETIQMTVKFDSAVEPGSTVSVGYYHQGPLPSDQTTLGNRLNFQETSSSDNKTFVMHALVDDTFASGEYVFGSLGVNKKGFRSGESSSDPNAPVITIQNPEKDPRQLTVPPFSIQLK